MRALDAGHTAPEVEAFLSVSQRTLFRWKVRQRSGQPLAPAARPGRPPTIRPVHHDARRTQVVAHPGATLAQQCQLWLTTTRVEVSVAGMARTLARLGITRNRRPHGSRTGRGGAGGVAGGGHDLGPGGPDLRR